MVIKTISGQVNKNYTIAMLNLNDHVFMHSRCSRLLCIIGHTPIDGIPGTDIASISVAIAAFFTLLHTAGVVFALFCLAFNIINRKKRSVANQIKNV